MKDFLGNELHVGDKVVFVRNASSSPGLGIGEITKIYNNDRECTVGDSSHVYKNRIMKL